jgi:hypothetical protein
MRSHDDWVFSGLHLPRPLDVALVATFLTRLAADRSAPRVALEVRADASGVRHLLGCRATDVQALGRALHDFIPGSFLTAPDTTAPHPRPHADVAGRLQVRPTGLPLRTDAAEDTTRALLSALAQPLRRGEAMVMQVVLGPRHAPRSVPTNAPDPDTTFVQLLTRGDRPASTETRARLKLRATQAGFAATLRIGASSPDRGRRRRFITSLLSAITTAQSPGLRVDLVQEHPNHLNNTRTPWRWPLHLSVPELVGLLAWPIGDHDLPGLPPAHPKPLRAASHVHSGERVFATSAVPGDRRRLGISPKDQTYHAVAWGPSGSGKTTVLLRLILADIDAGRPVAVLDPKRQLIDDILARIPDHRLNDVVELSASDDTPVGFNPLDVTGRDPDVVVDGVLSVFEAVFGDGWGPRTSDIFSASLRTLARASTPTSPATLVDLPRLWTDPRFRRQQVGRVSDDLALAGFWAWYDAQSPSSQAAAIAPPLNKLRQFLLRPALIRMLDQRGDRFRLRDLFRENKIVLVPLNEGLIGPGTASLLGSLVLADLWQATQERANEPGAQQRPGTIYVDEAPRFLHLPVSLADALAVSRSLSVGWFLAAQFRSQFPPALRTAVDMNARSKIAFATEYEDARDLAKLTSSLDTEDFRSLPRFHAYANLVAGGLPSGWALIKTLPPPPVTTDPDTVRRAARANYAPAPASVAADSGTATQTDEAVAEPTSPTAQPPMTDRIGRKRRQP